MVMKHWFWKIFDAVGPMQGFSTGVNNLLSLTLGIKVVRRDAFIITVYWVNQMLYLQRLFNKINNVPGDIVECGVGSGLSLTILAFLLSESSVDRHIWGFDSFEGLPEITVEDMASKNSIYDKHSKGRIAVSEKTTMATLRSISDIKFSAGGCGVSEDFINNNITLVKGWFSNTLPKYSGRPIALLHLDPDLYQSYKTAFEELWSRMSIGGIVVIDAYDETNLLPGCKKATDEFFGPLKVQLHKDIVHNWYYVIKEG